MSSPPVSATLGFSDALAHVRNLLNASTLYATNDDLERWPEEVIIDSIRGADALIYNRVGNTPGHPKRSELLEASSNILHAGLIPAHEGPLGTVLIGGKGGRVLPAQEIEQLRKAIFTFIDTGPYYDIVDNRLFYYAGSTATIDIVPPYDNAGAALLTPQSYYNGVVALALAMLFGKEGVETQTAGYYLSYGQAVMDQIDKGAAMIAPVVAYQGGMG